MPAFRSLTLRERADALAHRIGFERAQRAGIRTRLIALASVLPAMPKRPHVVVVPQEGHAFAPIALDSLPTDPNQMVKADSSTAPCATNGLRHGPPIRISPPQRLD